MVKKQGIRIENRKGGTNTPEIKKKATRGIKTFVDGIEFDSSTEAEYYKYLMQDPNVKEVVLQKEYQIIDPYNVECKRCRGAGKLLNGRTGNMNKCTLCDGKGYRTKQGGVYTADFVVHYKNGYIEVIDVKGYRMESDFSLRKRLWESRYHYELIVVMWDRKKKDWVRK